MALTRKERIGLMAARRASLDVKATEAALDGKAPTVHGHAISDVSGLQTALDGKQPVGSYVLTVNFTWDNLGGKPSTFPPSAHGHVIADVTGLQTALDAKLATAHFTWANLSGKPTTFTPSAHTHVIADVTGLQSALDGKQPVGSYLTGITSGMVTTALGYTPANKAGDIFSGIVTTTADFRAPIFYDSDDTGFYVNPNGTTRLTRLSFTGQFENPGTMNADWDGGYYHFAPTQNTPDGNWGHAHIIRLNADWNVQQFWPTGNQNMMWFRKRLSGSYGPWQSVMTGTANQWNQSSDGRNRLYFVSNDSTLFGTGGGYQWRNSSDNTILSLGSDGGLIATGLIVGRNGVGSNVNSMNDTGSFSVRGDANNAAAISFHRTGAYAVNMGLGTDAVFRVGGWSMQANCLQIYGSGAVQALNDFRAPTFYDSDNTAFYANPAGTSVMNTLALGGQSSAPQGAIWSGGNIWMVGDGRKLAFSTDGSPDDGGNVSIFAWGNDFRINNWSGSSLNDNFWVFGASRDAACAGNFTAYYSDERLKTRTGPLVNALQKVVSLDGFTYVENEVARSVGYANNEPQVGLSAQQVQAVLPEAVSLAPFDYDVKEDGSIVSKSGENYLTVDYSRLVPLLIEAIKELKAEVDSLKAQGN